MKSWITISFGWRLKLRLQRRVSTFFTNMCFLCLIRRKTSGCGCVTESQTGVLSEDADSTLAQACWRMRTCLIPSCLEQLLSPLKTSPLSLMSVLAPRKWRVSVFKIFCMKVKDRGLEQFFVWKSRVKRPRIFFLKMADRRLAQSFLSNHTWASVV